MVHPLLRASMRYASCTDRRKMAHVLRPIYTAATEEAAAVALEEFRAQWKTKSPGAVAVWDRAWTGFVPFLALPVEIGKTIYTTDEIVNPRAEYWLVCGVASARRGPRRPVQPARRPCSLPGVVACCCRQRWAGGGSRGAMAPQR